ncbi:type II toxin-antitoxin system RelE family toxin [Devosia sp.]|uniref:type II toxin-antitoxin system RelE family toxin n=1 Tax=Devosia sp. TaxID=1871048 RepID=UPI002EEC6254
MRAVTFEAAALRQWLKLSMDVRTRIDERLMEFARTGTGDVKRMVGRKSARLRVGDWRVLFHDDGRTITVIAVGHRRDVYGRN